MNKNPKNLSEEQMKISRATFPKFLVEYVENMATDALFIPPISKVTRNGILFYILPKFSTWVWPHLDSFFQP